MDTDLSEDEKKRQISELRHPKDRKLRKGGYAAKRPVICISDIECATMLYSLIQALTSAVKKSRVTAEAILFILIAQHAAFSDIVF